MTRRPRFCNQGAWLSAASASPDCHASIRRMVRRPRKPQPPLWHDALASLGRAARLVVLLTGLGVPLLARDCCKRTVPAQQVQREVVEVTPLARCQHLRWFRSGRATPSARARCFCRGGLGDAPCAGRGEGRKPTPLPPGNSSAPNRWSGACILPVATRGLLSPDAWRGYSFQNATISGLHF